MPPRTISACLIGDEEARTVSRWAASLAASTGAHLTGLAAVPDLGTFIPLTPYMAGPILLDSRAGMEDSYAKLSDHFEAACRAEGVEGEWRRVECSIDTLHWRLLDHVRASDVIVMPAARSGAGDSQGELQENIVRQAGRPVLVVPVTGDPAPIGRSAIVGWSPTREATRAAFDTAALLEEGAAVTLLHVGREATDELADGAMNDLAVALDRRGLKVTVSHRAPGEDGIAAVIRREAQETGAGLIASGAFGHSRAYDWVIGAVTRSLLAETGIPVLVSK